MLIFRMSVDFSLLFRFKSKPDLKNFFHVPFLRNFGKVERLVLPNFRCSEGEKSGRECWKIGGNCEYTEYTRLVFHKIGIQQEEKQQKHRKYKVTFQLRFQHTLKTAKIEQTVSAQTVPDFPVR